MMTARERVMLAASIIWSVSLAEACAAMLISDYWKVAPGLVSLCLASGVIIWGKD